MFEAAAVLAALRVLRSLRTAVLALLVLAVASGGSSAPRAGWTTVETVACASTQIASPTSLTRHESDRSVAALAALLAFEPADEDPEGHPGLGVALAAARWQAPGLRAGDSDGPGPTRVASTCVVLRAQAARGPPA